MAEENERRERFLQVYGDLKRMTGVEDAITLVRRTGAALDMELSSIIEHLSDNRPSTDGRGLPIAERCGWSPEFVARWYERGYVRQQPFFQRCRFEALPFAASDDELWSSSASLTQSQLRMREDMDRYGIRGMIAVPLHLPGGRLGAVVWATCKGTEVQSIVAAYCAELLVIGHMVMAQMSKVQPRRIAGGEGASLTERQLECIYWAAKGKTVQDTAVILGISKHTVGDYLREVIERLGAANIAHATALAAQYGILGAVEAQVQSSAVQISHTDLAYTRSGAHA